MGINARVVSLTRRLYLVMPGAPEVPCDELSGEKLWGEVDENKHYAFCESLVLAMESVANSGLKDHLFDGTD